MNLYIKILIKSIFHYLYENKFSLKRDSNSNIGKLSKTKNSVQYVNASAYALITKKLDFSNIQIEGAHNQSNFSLEFTLI